MESIHFSTDANCLSVGFEQKYKSLQGRWLEKSVGETNGSAGEDAKNPYSERNRLITVEVGANENRKECYFLILGNYTKSYNKWYPDSENQEWTKSIGKGKYRGCARMVQFDHSCGTYKDINPVSWQWAH